MIYKTGGFLEIGIVGVGILLLCAAVIGVLLYFFVRDEPEDSGFH